MCQIDIASTCRDAVWDGYMGNTSASNEDCSGGTIDSTDDGSYDYDSFIGVTDCYYFFSSSSIGVNVRSVCSSAFNVDAHIFFFFHFFCGFVQFPESIRFFWIGIVCCKQ